MPTGPKPQWKRGNSWRQGTVLPDEAARAFGLTHYAEPDKTCVLVISHDCDLAVDTPGRDDFVEVIVGRCLTELDETFTRTKNARRLHLPMRRNGTDMVGIEIEATKKALIPKQELAAWEPAAGYELEQKPWEALRTWLAIRYKRPAFPDEFDRRMESVDDALAKIALRYTKRVSGVYLVVDPWTSLPPDERIPYKVKVYVLYEVGDDIEKSRDMAEAAVKEIEACFRRKFFDKATETWTSIALLDVQAQSENAVTVANLKKMRERRLEFVSLKPDQPAAERPDI